ncbi:PEP-CTERM sorting domain-containing protein [Aquabacterium sp. CECT 9606]|uniref:PEP-CTERM sorting domain-containing protein n=1 Tax=Aquabacterium sp. CECT 9606 TaxID=2845822 RepID=UPI001E331737|nr:PEP-CTERM sorting domain-containing protein [Aquabacterium sp. CECT 9606]
MTKKYIRAVAMAAAAVSAMAYAGLTQAAPTPALQLTLLDSAGARFSEANAIANSGAIVGAAAQDWGIAFRATAWQGGAFNVVGGNASRALGVNDAGQSVGLTYWRYNETHAMVWSNGTAKDLHTFGAYKSEARDINASGKVAGWAFYTVIPIATVWDASTGQRTDLSGIESEAYAINDSGQVAGWQNVGGYMHATVWTGTQAIDLGIPGQGSLARGINESGLVVGTSSDSNWTNFATVWNGTVATRLSSLSYGDSHAWDINNHGLVVGNSRDPGTGGQHATLWVGTDIVDLNTYLDPALALQGWVLTTATGVNDQGWIVGMAEQSINGDLKRSAFLLSPIPEPSAYGMALAGLGVTALMSRRRQRRNVTQTC